MAAGEKVVDLESYRRSSQKEMIDDVGARAFLFLRDSSEELNLPMTDVIAEHILGLSLVMASVDGQDSAQSTLEQIISQLGKQ